MSLINKYNKYQFINSTFKNNINHNNNKTLK